MMKTMTVPRFFKRNNERDRLAIELLQAEGMITKRLDVLRTQMLQLASVRSPARWEGIQHAERASQLDALNELLSERSPDEYAVEVFLPWLKLLIRMLPKDDFNELRCARNRNKITVEEQHRLQRLSIGVAGMSSGGAIARVLALGGLCGRLRLADFDELETSNLNRLHAGVHELGLNKAIICAQRILENNPYQDISVFTSGIHADNVADFIEGRGRLDILIEQIDDLGMKVEMRRRARQHGVIVIMETNDRGLLDIERFDQEPARPLLHGLLDHTALHETDDDDQRMQFILDILEGQPSPRLNWSFGQLGLTVSGWPQLASEVTLGAATVAHTVHQIGMGRDVPSGRYTFDLSRLLSRGRLGQAA